MSFFSGRKQENKTQKGSEVRDSIESSGVTAQQKATDALKKRGKMKVPGTEDEEDEESSAMKELEKKGLFKEGYDPVRTALESVDEADMSESKLNGEAQALYEKGMVLQERLSSHILANYNKFVEGMNQVTAIMGSLRVAGIVARNGRRFLESANGGIEDALHIARSQRRKAALLELLQVSYSLREVVGVEQRVASHFEAGEFVEAVCAYARAQEAMEKGGLGRLSFAGALQERLARCLWNIVQKVETVLFSICGSFASDDGTYERVFQAYLVLGREVKPLGDKVQESFLRLVEARTDGVLRGYALSSGTDAALEAAKKPHASFGELARHIPPSLYKECFQKTLQTLAEVLSSHRAMHLWHTNRIETGVSGANEPEVLDKERQACSEVSGGLERSKRSVWELAAMRASSLLSQCPVFEEGAVTCRAVSGLAKSLAHLGESFTGSSASSLMTAISRAQERMVKGCAEKGMEKIREHLATERHWETAGKSEMEEVVRYLKMALSSAERAASAAKKKNADRVSQSMDFNELVKYCMSNSEAFAAGGEREEEKSGEKIGKGSIVGEESVHTHCTVWILHETAEALELASVVDDEATKERALALPREAFEAGLAAVYRSFGEDSALYGNEGDQGQQSAQQDENASFEEPTATPRLSKILTRVLDANSPDAVKAEAIPGEEVLGSGNLHGMRERCMAADAMVNVKQALEACKPSLKGLVSKKGASAVDHWHAHMAVVADDLREHVLLAGLRRLMPIHWLPETICTLGRYNVQEVGAETSPWVSKLESEVARLKESIHLAALGEKVQESLWQFAAQRVASFEIEGLARVKKCTRAGRDQMLLDHQSVESAMRTKAPIGCDTPPALQRARAYIQAFHEPDDAIPDWLQAHPEFTEKQLTSLARHIAQSRGWSRKKLRDVENAVQG